MYISVFDPQIKIDCACPNWKKKTFAEDYVNLYVFVCVITYKCILQVMFFVLFFVSERIGRTGKIYQVVDGGNNQGSLNPIGLNFSIQYTPIGVFWGARWQQTYLIR